MENNNLKKESDQFYYAIEECRAALAFEELMNQQGYVYHSYDGDCGLCEAEDLCDCVCSIITVIDKREHSSGFYCGLASELRTGKSFGYYECKFKKTTDGGTVQSSDGIDRVPVEPHGDVY